MKRQDEFNALERAASLELANQQMRSLGYKYLEILYNMNQDKERLETDQKFCQDVISTFFKLYLENEKRITDEIDNISPNKKRFAKTKKQAERNIKSETWGFFLDAYEKVSGSDLTRIRDVL